MVGAVTPSFVQLREDIDVGPLKAQLDAHPELWGQQRARMKPGSPHTGTVDIWARYRDLDAYRAEFGEDMSHFVDEHESVWLPPSDDLPAIKTLASELCEGYRLGGVLLTLTPPGGQILPHTDHGWHAEVHQKLYLPIQVTPEMEFGWEDGVMHAREGDLWWFRNDRPHWVNNPTLVPRIGAIFCVRAL